MVLQSSSATQHQAAVALILRATYRMLCEAHPQLLGASQQRDVQVFFAVFVALFFSWALWQLMRTRPSRRR